MPNYTTGPSLLPDVGELSYDGCVFSPLFETTVSGTAVKDSAGRTTKYMEYTLVADGYVTLPTGDPNISATMETLRRRLTAQGKALVYTGRGFSLLVNNNVLVSQDVAWGPIPKMLEFQPLGGGMSAKIKWQVVVHLPEITGSNPPDQRLLQFNYETSLTYGEDGYSSMTIRGTMEIPMTRSTAGGGRGVATTVDKFRPVIETRLFRGIDLSRFRILRREFSVSRDKRTMEFDIEMEEKPYMDLPPFCTVARGSYNVRPARAGMGLVSWHCTLKVTYTVRADEWRRVAWFRFLDLLRLRMLQAERPDLTPLPTGAAPPPRGPNLVNVAFVIPSLIINQLRLPSARTQEQSNAENLRRALLIDFSFDEGLYLDSKTVSFSATWRMVVFLQDILLASGLWTKMPERHANGRNVWETTVGDISGVQSWLPNRLDPRLDVVVDFGGG